MKNHARFVVIGGGIAGCSTLYHQTKLRWPDVVLVESGMQLPLLRDPDTSYYMRQEAMGFLIGLYEAISKIGAHAFRLVS